MNGGDDFTRMKGVGPRLAESLHGLGFNRFEQLAALSDRRSNGSTSGSAPSRAG